MFSEILKYTNSVDKKSLVYLLDFLPGKTKESQTYLQLRRQVVLQNIILQIVMQNRICRLKPKLNRVLQALKALSPDFDVEKPKNKQNVTKLIAVKYKRPLEEIRIDQTKRFK